MRVLLRSWRRLAGAWFVLVLALAVRTSADDTSFTLTSTVTTNGWYSYDLRGRWNAFFSSFYDIVLAPGFTNFVAAGPHDATEFNHGPSQVGWRWDGTAPKEFQHLVSAQSSSAHATIRANAYVMFAAVIAAWTTPGYVSKNIVGYARMPVLEPTDDPAAGVTNTVLASTMVIVPDPKITGWTPYTISYEWGANATMLIQASGDLKAWSNVAYSLSYPGTNTWTSSVPLDVWGKHFRVVLVSGRHQTNLVQSGRPALPKRVGRGTRNVAPAPVRALCPMRDGTVGVTLAAQRGLHYQVEMRNALGKTLVTKEFSATGRLTTVVMPDLGSTQPVFIEARPLP